MIDPFFGSIISGGLSFLGGLGAQDKTDERLQAQMRFQEKMSNTAYQRAMADMRKAGLNPMLAYSKGGASTPTGASAPASDIISPAISTAMQQRRLSADLENLTSTNEQIQAQTEKVGDERKNVQANTRQLEAATKILGEELKSAEREGVRAKADLDTFQDPNWKNLRTLGTILRELGIGGQSPRGGISIQPYKGN